MIFLLLDDTFNEICQEKGLFVREISGNCREIHPPDLTDTLYTTVIRIQKIGVAKGVVNIFL